MSRRRAHWLLDVEIDGRAYRWSEESVDVETAGGDVLTYAAGLGELELAQGEPDVDVDVLDESVDWPTLAPQLDGQRTTLRRWLEGTFYEQAETYAFGEVSGTSFGARHEEVSWDITQASGSELTLGVQVPDPLARIDESTWPISVGATIGDAGAIYPVLFGYPGFTGAADPVCVVPVPLGQFLAAGTTYCILSEDADAPITEVRIANESETSVPAYETGVIIRDELGRSIGASHFTAAAGPAPANGTEARELFAGFRPSGGGGVARSAYDSITYLLKRWGAGGVDWERLPEVRDILDGFQVDTWIDEATSDPWAWIESVLLPDLPVEIRTSTRGRFLFPRRYVSDPRRRVGSIEIGRDAERVSDVSRASSQGPANEFTALYRANTRGDWLGRVILSGDPTRIGSAPTLIVPPTTATQQTTVATSAACRRSLARYRLRQAAPIQIDWTWDTGTVLKVLEWRAERDATPGLAVELEVDDGEDLVEGDEVLITDEDLRWVDRPGIVDEPPVRGDRTTVVLRIPE